MTTLILNALASRYQAELMALQVNIENYIESIKFINNKGGWVIRIGDKGSPKLPKMENQNLVK